MRNIILAVLLLAVVAQARLSTENFGLDFFETEIKKLMPAETVQDEPTCTFSLAGQCFGTLKQLFEGCKDAIESEGKSIAADFACVKSLWSLRNSNLKQCVGCICEFTKLTKIKLPFCDNKQISLVQDGIQIFQKLMNNGN